LKTESAYARLLNDLDALVEQTSFIVANLRVIEEAA